MKAKFVRGASSREEILDKLLDRIITVEMPTYDVQVKNGTLDTRYDENTKDLVDELDKAGISYEVTGEDDAYTYIEISGTKKQLLRVFPLWDSMTRLPEELEEDLADWEGDPEQLFNVLF